MHQKTGLSANDMSTSVRYEITVIIRHNPRKVVLDPSASLKLQMDNRAVQIPR